MVDPVGHPILATRVEHDTTDKNKKEREPVEDGGVEDNLHGQPKIQERIQDDASATEQPKQESNCDDASAMDKNEGSKEEPMQDNDAAKKHTNEEKKSKSLRKGKEMHTRNGAELVDEIIVLSSGEIQDCPAADSDKGAMKTDDNAENAGNARKILIIHFYYLLIFFIRSK